MTWNNKGTMNFPWNTKEIMTLRREHQRDHALFHGTSVFPASISAHQTSQATWAGPLHATWRVKIIIEESGSNASNKSFESRLNLNRSSQRGDSTAYNTPFPRVKSSTSDLSFWRDHLAMQACQRAAFDYPVTSLNDTSTRMH